MPGSSGSSVLVSSRHSKGFEWGIIYCGIWRSMGVEAEFRETESGLVTKARSLDSLFTSLERLVTTLSSVLSWATSNLRAWFSRESLSMHE